MVVLATMAPTVIDAFMPFARSDTEFEPAGMMNSPIGALPQLLVVSWSVTPCSAVTAICTGRLAAAFEGLAN